MSVNSIVSQNLTQPIECELLCLSSAEHLSQIYTGFGLLERQGLVKVRITRLPGYTVGTLANPKLRVILNKNIKVVYDTFDGEDVDRKELTWCDFYFKRSCYNDYSGNPVDTESKKIFPLGFNYSAYGPGDYSFVRLMFGLVSIKSLADINKALVSLIRLTPLSYLLRTSSGKNNAIYSKFENSPFYSNSPYIIFFARLWDPERTKHIPLKDEREAMNQMRVEIIRKMKRNFGNSFIGGLEPTDFANRFFKDCVVEDPRIVYKKNYMKLLQSSSIGIATAGLMKSNGWKIAEYIAGAKAIVSEKLSFQVPGDFQEPKNYLHFGLSDEAVEQAGKLMENSQLRYEMMVRNLVYYHLYLRPDVLIWNTLRKCTQQESSSKKCYMAGASNSRE